MIRMFGLRKVIAIASVVGMIASSAIVTHPVYAGTDPNAVATSIRDISVSSGASQQDVTLSVTLHHLKTRIRTLAVVRSVGHQCTGRQNRWASFLLSARRSGCFALTR
jgi:hypothetical protein